MRNILVPIIALFYGFNLWAQKPTEYPKPSEKPVDLSNTADIVIYIVLPIIAVLLYLLYRRNKKK